MSEPRTWQLPAEPPVGTVVGPVDKRDNRRWRRLDCDAPEAFEYGSSGPHQSWLDVDPDTGKPVASGLAWWGHVMRECGYNVREYPDPSDPDGTQSELDTLRAQVARLDQALRDAAENLTQAEKDRDDAGVLLGRAQNDRAEAQREAEQLRQKLRSIAIFADKSAGSAVTS